MVIPAEAGIYTFCAYWIPAFAGMTRLVRYSTDFTGGSYGIRRKYGIATVNRNIQRQLYA